MQYLSLRKGTPASGYWDQTLIDELLQDYSGDREVVIVPGAYQDKLADKISEHIKQYKKVLLIITSDEENNFPICDVYHKNIVRLLTYPNKAKHWRVDGFLPIGVPPKANELIKEYGVNKELDWFFSGQINHESRGECFNKLMTLDNGKLIGTDGFAKGLEYPEYMSYMCKAKVVPCPAGNVSPDSFRLYESLEAGCIPIAENKEFWQMLFGEVPFPVVENWEELPELINHFKDRPDVANRCYAWWQLKKRELKWQISQY